MKKMLLALLQSYAFVLPVFSVMAQTPSDEKAILATSKEGFEAFNAYDADRFALVYTETAVLIDPFGGITQGRENIRQSHKAMFQFWGGNPKGNSYVFEKQSVRFLSPETAIVNIVCANSRTIQGNNVKDRATYTITVVKKDNKWLCDNLQITPIVPPLGAPQN